MSEWIEWSGGDNPCPPGAVVIWRTRDEMFSDVVFGPAEAKLLNWSNWGTPSDIVEFRIVGDVVMRGPAEPELVLPLAARTTTGYTKFRGYRSPYPTRSRA